MPTSIPLPVNAASPLDTLLIILCSPVILDLFRFLETIQLILILLVWYTVGLIVKRKNFRPRFKFGCAISLCLYWCIFWISHNYLTHELTFDEMSSGRVALEESCQEPEVVKYASYLSRYQFLLMVHSISGWILSWVLSPVISPKLALPKTCIL